jgi:hypothetical protein
VHETTRGAQNDVALQTADSRQSCRSCRGETLRDACMRCSQSLSGRSLRWCDGGAPPVLACVAAPPAAAASRAACRPQRLRVCTAAARKRAQGDTSTAGGVASGGRPPPQSPPPAADDETPKDFWEGEQWESLGTAASYGIVVVALLGGVWARSFTPSSPSFSRLLCPSSHCGCGGHVHLQRRRRRG